MLSWIYTLCWTKELTIWVSKNTWNMFYYEFSQIKVINSCPSTTIFYSCEQDYVSVDTLYAVGNDEQQEYLGFSGLSIKRYPIIIDDINKIRSTRIKSTPQLNIYEKQLKNPICEYIDKNEYDKG